MKNLKLLLTLICSVALFSMSSTAKAGKMGVVDLNKVLENYTVSQEVAADLKVKEKELQQFVLEAQKKINEAQTPVEKKNLEDKLGEQFNIKKNAFAKEQSEKWQKIEEDVFKVIEKVSNDKKLEMVFSKQSVIIGGDDITKEVTKRLNDEAKKAKKK